MFCTSVMPVVLAMDSDDFATNSYQCGCDQKRMKQCQPSSGEQLMRPLVPVSRRRQKR